MFKELRDRRKRDKMMAVLEKRPIREFMDAVDHIGLIYVKGLEAESGIHEDPFRLLSFGPLAVAVGTLVNNKTITPTEVVVEILIGLSKRKQKKFISLASKRHSEVKVKLEKALAEYLEGSNLSIRQTMEDDTIQRGLDTIKRNPALEL